MVVSDGLVAHPCTAREMPRTDAPATAQTSRIRMTVEIKVRTSRGAILMALTIIQER